MRPRHALTLLALALPLPAVLLGFPTTATTSGAAPEPPLLRTPVLHDEAVSPPAPRPRTPRPTPRRVASRHRVTLQRHHVARATTPTATRTHHASTHHAARPSSASYPWASASGDTHDTWGFTARQCVSYVAWRLSRLGRPVYSSAWGSASRWDDVARSRGVTVTTRPSVGSVAQWNAGERSTAYSSGSPNGSFVAGSYGHVAWVTQVYSDGSVQVAQYNGTGDRSYSTMRVRAPRFLRL